MPVFYPLKDIANVHPRYVGEMATLLYQLQQAGHPVAESWVIPSEHFRRSLQKLTAREPLFVDWPQLLWETPSIQGYAGQHLARRLCQPLQRLSLNLPLETLVETIQFPVVRLLPSLWLGDTYTSADFAPIMGVQVCWAEVDAIEMALKQLWMKLVSAHGLAYWSRWQNVMGEPSRPYPQQIDVAVVVQAVEPVTLSGTLTVHLDNTVIQAVQGLPQAIAQSCPDIYQGQLPSKSPVAWQQGYQEYTYQPLDTSFAASQIGDCLTSASTSNTASAMMSPATETNLLNMAQQLQTWAVNPITVEWVIPTAHTTLPQITQVYRRLPTSTPKKNLADHHSPSHVLSGKPASPGQVVGIALVINPGDPLPTSAHQQVVITREVAPNWLPLLQTAAAIVSETGGLTCHAAILARELQLPAVVGVANATQRLHTGDTLWLDGEHGIVKPLANQQTIRTAPHSLPSIAKFNHKTEIWLNLSQPDQAHDAAQLPVAGVGLLRSEWLMMTVLDHQHPYEWLKNGQGSELLEHLAAQLRPILQAFAPRPVRYRSLDIRSHEFAQMQGAPPIETNPMLGIRGTFSYQMHPEFFRLELAVLRQLQLEGYTNLQLLLPFVRTVEEVQYCQQLIQEADLDQFPDFQLWIMAEVPSVLFLMPQYVAVGVQGIAIGTNDLTQLLLGIDRDQAIFSAHFDERHPAVQAAIAQLIQQAQSLQIPCTLCGVAAAHHADLISSLVRQGISSISVDVAAIAATTKAIQEAETF